MMKGKLTFIFVFGCLLFLLGYLLLSCECCSWRSFSIKTQAQVLSVNENILAGKLMGAFLSSSSGYLSNDINKVGVKIEVFGELFLKDLELSHAILAYYKDGNEIPVVLNFVGFWHSPRRSCLRCKIRILGEYVDDFYVSDDLHCYLYKKSLSNIEQEK